MIRLIRRAAVTMAAIGTLAAGIAFAAPAHAGTLGNFPRQDVATCGAYRLYVARPTRANFRMLRRDSRTADFFIGTDVRVWHADRVGHAPRAVLRQDQLIVRTDCSDPSANLFG